jgi:CO/xanthine dehydrogenase FAD-binding subunit
VAAVKPAPFDYAAPRSVDEALGLLGEDAKVLAGGQSLVPIMNFRLARPGTLVDINRIDELAYLRKRDGVLHIGALTRHATLERSELAGHGWPLLGQALRHVGHVAIRTRGTIGGSCAHADPTSEFPVALTALDDDELLVEVEVPPLPAGARTAFAEHARTHGDWAMVGAAVVVAPGYAAVALLGAGPTPLRATAAEAALVGGAGAEEAARLAGELVAGEWRAAMTTALVRRALGEAGA